MPRREPTRSSKLLPSWHAKGMFSRVRAEDPKGLVVWGSGLRFVALCLGAGFVVTLTFGRTRPSNDAHKAAFERVAQLVNEPLRGLQPFHSRVAPARGGDMVMVDSRREACVEAAHRADELANITLPDEESKAVESAGAVRRAAGLFVQGSQGCQAGGGVNAAATCVLECMRRWAVLVGRAEQLRRDAARVGVPVEPIAFAGPEQDREEIAGGAQEIREPGTEPPPPPGSPSSRAPRD